MLPTQILWWNEIDKKKKKKRSEMDFKRTDGFLHTIEMTKYGSLWLFWFARIRKWYWTCSYLASDKQCKVIAAILTLCKWHGVSFYGKQNPKWKWVNGWRERKKFISLSLAFTFKFSIYFKFYCHCQWASKRRWCILHIWCLRLFSL